MHAAAVFSIFQIVGISVGTQRRAQLVFDLKCLAPKAAQPRQNDGGQSSIFRYSLIIKFFRHNLI